MGDAGHLCGRKQCSGLRTYVQRSPSAIVRREAVSPGRMSQGHCLCVAQQPPHTRRADCSRREGRAELRKADDAEGQTPCAWAQVKDNETMMDLPREFGAGPEPVWSWSGRGACSRDGLFSNVKCLPASSTQMARRHLLGLRSKTICHWWRAIVRLRS